MSRRLFMSNYRLLQVGLELWVLLDPLGCGSRVDGERSPYRVSAQQESGDFSCDRETAGGRSSWGEGGIESSQIYMPT